MSMARTTATFSVSLPPEMAEELERVRKYAEDYGEGGFQERFRLILRATKPRPATLEDRW